MADVVLDALIDSAKMVPLLFVIYFLIEALEYRFGSAIRARIAGAHRRGPLYGTLFGLLPQCGFSVVGAALYSQRLVTIGTLLAIFLATSDEAIPIILSQPAAIPVLMPLLAGKVVIALVGGYGADWLLARHRFAPMSCGHDHVHGEQFGCCHHDVAGGRRKRDLLLHPLRHTATVFLFVFVTSLVLGLIISSVGEENVGRFLLKGSFLQPAVVALVGLIPNCAASVVITQTFLDGGIGFGAAMAGLATSGGLGLLVLFRESRCWSDILRVIGFLYAISVVAGLAIQSVWG